jgi:hypothetical protein
MWVSILRGIQDLCGCAATAWCLVEVVVETDYGQVMQFSSRVLIRVVEIQAVSEHVGGNDTDYFQRIESENFNSSNNDCMESPKVLRTPPTNVDADAVESEVRDQET